MICTLILTVGMIAIAGLLAVTTHMHIGAREAARSIAPAICALESIRSGKPVAIPPF